MKNKLKKLTSPQLIYTAYRNIEDKDIYWKCIHILHTRGTEEIFNITKEMVYSQDNLYRQLSADILAQFAYKTKLFHDECIYLLAKLMHDKNENVITEAIYGLSYRRALYYHKDLSNLSSHTSTDIREAVAHALGSIDTKEAIDALILLMIDKDFEVRNWATFSLGQMIERNTPQICDALYQNLSDEEFEVRGEALLGLALHKDERVKDIIIEDLQKPFYGSWIFTSIEEVPDSKYIPYFENYIKTLNEEDKKAFSSDIEKARKALSIIVGTNK